MTGNPYQTPRSTRGIDMPPQSSPPGGIRRLPYWIAIIVMVAVTAALGKAGLLDTRSDLSFIAPLAFSAVGAIPAYFRFRNIGMNPTMGFLMVVPLVNYFVIFRCLVFQEHYQIERKLDSTGKILIAILILAVVCLVFGMILEAK